MTMVGTQAPRTLFGGYTIAECADTGDGDAEYYCGDAELCGFEGILNAQNAQKALESVRFGRGVRLRIRRDSSSKMWG